MDGISALVSAAVMLAAGVLVVVTAKKGAAGTLKPNPMVGIRTRLTMSSDAAWYAAHRASASVMNTAGWGAVAASVASFAFAFAPIGTVVNPIMAGLVLAGAAWLLVFVLIGAVRGQRAAEKVITQETNDSAAP